MVRLKEACVTTRLSLKVPQIGLRAKLSVLSELRDSK